MRRAVAPVDSRSNGGRVPNPQLTHKLKTDLLEHISKLRAGVDPL
jgi:hypothetical protein